MAANSPPSPNYWAVIIGINYYRNDRCLKGSVRDAESVKLYLETEGKVLHIDSFTATSPPDLNSRHPIEDPTLWPTRANIVTSLKNVLAKAKPNDIVYIHYSGHGTRTPNLSERRYNKARELALVLFEDNDCGSSYLRGSHLAGALRNMVKKGLFVTLVLDCCFSGSIIRDSNGPSFDVRSVEYNAEIDISGAQESEESVFDVVDEARIYMEEDWLVNPKGFTALTGCGPHERAWELENNGERWGALTYFLLNALSTFKKRGEKITHGALHEYIYSQFHVSWPRQNPMRYGNATLSFFGNHTTPGSRGKLITANHVALVYKRDDGTLGLGAGAIHGVYEGDEYIVYSHENIHSATERSIKDPISMAVASVRSFESDLENKNPSPESMVIETGWKAKLVTSLSPRKVRIGLLSSIETDSTWRQVTPSPRFLTLVAKSEAEEPCLYKLGIQDGNFVVFNAVNETVAGLPTIPTNQIKAANTAMALLEHIAAFKFFEGIENRLTSTNFEKSFSLTTHQETGPTGRFNVQDGNEWKFKIQNFGNQPLYMAIFDFMPSWGIINLVSQSGEGSYLVIPPKTEEEKGEMEIPLLMEVPQSVKNHGRNECEDIIKVFITSKPAPYASMILPDINSILSEGDNSNRGSDHISNLLTQLKIGFRGRDSSPGDGWATRNYVICTYIQ